MKISGTVMDNVGSVIGHSVTLTFEELGLKKKEEPKPVEQLAPFYDEIRARPDRFQAPHRIQSIFASDEDKTKAALTRYAEKKESNKLIRKLNDPEKFMTSLGMEFSYLLDITKRNPFSSGYQTQEKRIDSDSHRASGLCALIQADFQDLPKELHPYKVNNDEGAIEIASPPFFSLEHAETFWRALTGIAKNYPLVTHREDSYSGGGHIHLKIPENVTKDTLHLNHLMTNIFRDVTNRPYLNWIFNEWCDIQSAKSWAASHWVAPTQGFNWANNKELGIHLRRRHLTEVFDGPKGYACRMDDADSWDDKPPTIEFRFFDMVTDWKELKAHLKFANQYLRYIYSKTEEGTLVDLKVKDEKAIAHLADKDRGLSEFKELLGELGLKYGDYDTFVRKNYRKRKAENLLK